MTNTELRQILGCGFRNDLRNDFTLVDAGKLYESVVNGSKLIGHRARRLLAAHGPAAESHRRSGIGQIVVAEANAIGMTTAKRNSFLANMRTRSKGGSYDICGTTCNPYTYIRTVGGVITIPTKSRAGATVLTNYVYGRFADGLNIPCQVKGPNESVAAAEARCSKYKNANAALTKVGTEMFRSIIKSALKTWK